MKHTPIIFDLLTYYILYIYFFFFFFYNEWKVWSNEELNHKKKWGAFLWFFPFPVQTWENKQTHLRGDLTSYKAELSHWLCCILFTAWWFSNIFFTAVGLSVRSFPSTKMIILNYGMNFVEQSYILNVTYAGLTLKRHGIAPLLTTRGTLQPTNFLKTNTHSMWLLDEHVS